MLLFQFVDFGHVLVLLALEVLLPLDVEFLQRFFTNLDVIFKLSLLDIRAQFVLVCHNLGLKKPNFAH